MGASISELSSTEEYYKKYERFVIGMPKVALHEHVGGSVCPRLAYKLIERAEGKVIFDGHHFKSADELEAYVHRPVSSLEEYLHKYNATRAVFGDIQNIPLIINTIVKKFKAENVMHLELRTALKALDFESGANITPPYTPEQELATYTNAIKEAAEKYQMSIGLILCMRRGDTEVNHRLADATVSLATKFMDQGVVGIDLAGKEKGNPATPFIPYFKEAKKRGLNVTIHGAEGFGEEAFNDLVAIGPDRFGHGVAGRRWSRAYELAMIRQIPFEVCISSNVQTGAIYTDPDTREALPISSYEMHPFIQMLNDGQCITISCDNREVSNTTLTDEYLLLNRKFGLHRGRVINLAHNAIRSAFVSEERKKEMLRIFRRYADTFEVNP